MKRIRLIPLLAGVLACFLASCTGRAGSSIPATKKGIMDSFVAGTLDPSYVPAAFFVNFGSDEAISAHLKYFHETGMDILKVQFEQTARRFPPWKKGP